MEGVNQVTCKIAVQEQKESIKNDRLAKEQKGKEKMFN